ncbi:flagellar hook-length control protein FliK [Virgibacillus sp. C22-A2]|uniref:Flagellar hook-length control protein FliK n=1 Tax=Virgibacillus tibetensis TaxID=3042313 RepID=A0ABU6KBY9_9BACI|nr:flagellar hook-length control protein FliK [Virgibacillus sp. C22-A2]
MNAIGMLFQQIQLPKTSAGVTRQPGSGEDVLSFNSLLNTEQSEVESELDEALSFSQQTGANKGMKSNDPLTGEQELYSLLINSGHLELAAVDEQTKDTINSLINNLIMEKATASDQHTTVVNQTELTDEDIVLIHKEFAAIFSKIEKIVMESNKNDFIKSAPKVLDLLQQWSALERQIGNEKWVSDPVSSLKNEGTKEHAIWKELVQAFEKRNQLSERRQYMESKVTSTDVAKWMGKAMDNQTQVDRVIGQQTITPSGSAVPITRLEQYVIHVNSSQNSESTDKQMVEQFQKVINSSKFLSKPNGTNQLSITLRPDNLGEMMVRLTQVNGEMTVKILVSSLAAKEMLETNMSQLRNMFSPHQVVIEKQELNLNTQQEQDVQKEAKEEQLKDQENQSHSDQNKEQQTEDDFAAQFHELLMNEKV